MKMKVLVCLLIVIKKRNQSKVNISKLNQGLYLVKGQDINGTIGFEKVVKKNRN